jgi:4'-phosphopantetheinyl transferase
VSSRIRSESNEVLPCNRVTVPQRLQGPHIGADRIRIWTVTVNEVPESIWPRLVGLLDVAEQKRAARFLFDRDRRLYLSAHALKRLMLTAAAGGAVAPGAWTFKTDGQGKPRVACRPAPQFNLSHCDGLTACAVSAWIELGIDVESVERCAPLELAATCFAPAEQAWLRSQPAAARPLGFFQLWTLKEAFIKATGSGLAQSLDAFAFSFNPLRVTFANPALGDPSAWHFAQRRVGDRHILAVAWRTAAARVLVEISEVQLEALVHGRMAQS